MVLEALSEQGSVVAQNLLTNVSVLAPLDLMEGWRSFLLNCMGCGEHQVDAAPVHLSFQNFEIVKVVVRSLSTGTAI